MACKSTLPFQKKAKEQKEHFFSNATGKDLECAILKESVTVLINVVVTHTKKYCEHVGIQNL